MARKQRLSAIQGRFADRVIHKTGPSTARLVPYPSVNRRRCPCRRRFATGAVPIMPSICSENSTVTCGLTALSVRRRAPESSEDGGEALARLTSSFTLGDVRSLGGDLR
jgi:hypothetical protein